MQRRKTKTKSTAGPSTPFGATNAPNYAKDDNYVVVQSLLGRINISISRRRHLLPLGFASHQSQTSQRQRNKDHGHRQNQRIVAGALGDQRLRLAVPGGDEAA